MNALMTTELYWLTLTALMTALFWVPYIPLVVRQAFRNFRLDRIETLRVSDAYPDEPGRMLEAMIADSNNRIYDDKTL